MLSVSVAHNAVRRSAGFTLNTNSNRSPRVGYMVSCHKDRERVVSVSDKRSLVLAIVDYLVSNADLLSQPGNYFGGWSDGGNFYLDISQRVFTLDHALTLAHQHNQIAIWCLHEQREVRL